MIDIDGQIALWRIVQFAQAHPNDGWGGWHTSVHDLKDAANIVRRTHSQVEDDLKSLHLSGRIYLQRWNSVQFQPWDGRDRTFFDGTFRILPARPVIDLGSQTI
jgi:hypothetical protein